MRFSVFEEKARVKLKYCLKELPCKVLSTVRKLLFKPSQFYWELSRSEVPIHVYVLSFILLRFFVCFLSGAIDFFLRAKPWDGLGTLAELWHKLGGMFQVMWPQWVDSYFYSYLGERGLLQLFFLVMLFAVLMGIVRILKLHLKWQHALLIILFYLFPLYLILAFFSSVTLGSLLPVLFGGWGWLVSFYFGAMSCLEIGGNLFLMAFAVRHTMDLPWKLSFKISFYFTLSYLALSGLYFLFWG